MRERDLAQPRKAKIFFRQGRLLCNARVKETRSTQLNAPNFVIKELSVMLVANKQEQQCQEKSGEQGVRGEQGGPRRGGGFEGRREHAQQGSFVHLRLSIAQVHPSSAK